LFQLVNVHLRQMKGHVNTEKSIGRKIQIKKLKFASRGTCHQFLTVIGIDGAGCWINGVVAEAP
jgi:hypothetical protein